MFQFVSDKLIKVQTEGGGYEELKVPDCFSFIDVKDPSCWRCKVKVWCKEYQEQTKPECFAVLHDETAPECKVCLFESQCAEAQLIKEGIKMPKILIRKPVAAAAPVVADEPEVEETVVEQPKKTLSVKKVAAPAPEPAPEPEVVDTFGLTEMPIEQLRELAEKFDLATDGRKSVLVTRLLSSPTAVDYFGKLAAGEIDVEKPVATDASVLLELCFRLQEGQSLLLTPTDDGQYVIRAIGIPHTANIADVPVDEDGGKKLSGDAYYKEVYTSEYYDFMYRDAGDGKGWTDHSSEEKIALAKAAEVQWAEHSDPKINMMNMFAAVTAALGVEKYKPEYKTQASRKAIQA